MFKTAREIYNEMYNELQSRVPNLTGKVVSALLYVVALAISSVWYAVNKLWFNIWPQHADRDTLRKFYEEWGLDWDYPDEETARKVVLSQYRCKGIGTKGWYRDVVLQNFGNYVDNVEVLPNERGPGTIDIYVYFGNRVVDEGIVSEIQELFEQDEYRVAGIDVKVYSRVLSLK